jgi:hypothetical protein
LNISTKNKSINQKFFLKNWNGKKC